MPTTLTSSLVNAIRAGTKNLPIVPGRPMATVVSLNVTASGTVTVGQVIQMVPIPSGAEILDLWVVSEWTGNGAGVFSVGDGSTTNRYVVSASLTASSRITRAAGGLGYKYSVSDDAAVGFGRFDTIDLNIGAGATQTATGSVLMTVYWRYVGETNEQQG